MVHKHHIVEFSPLVKTPLVSCNQETSSTCQDKDATSHPFECERVQALKRRHDEELANLNVLHVRTKTVMSNNLDNINTEILRLERESTVHQATQILILEEMQLLEASLLGASEQQDRDQKVIVNCNKRCAELESQSQKLSKSVEEAEESLAASGHLVMIAPKAHAARARYLEINLANKALATRLESLVADMCCLCDKPATLTMECCKALICGACQSSWKAEKAEACVQLSCLYCRASPTSTRSLRRACLLGSAGMPIHVE